MPDSTNILRTHVSQSFWCNYSREGGSFERATICFGPCKHLDGPRKCTRHSKPGCENGHEIAWFDQLFRDGIRLPSVQEAGSSISKPLTVLVAGPPGTGKTTLCSEICYNLAQYEGLFSLYVSTESEAGALISNFASFGHEHVNRFVTFDPDRCKNEGEPQVYVWGKERVDKVNQTNGAIDIVEAAIKDIVSYFAAHRLSSDRHHPGENQAEVVPNWHAVPPRGSV